MSTGAGKITRRQILGAGLAVLAAGSAWSHSTFRTPLRRRAERVQRQHFGGVFRDARPAAAIGLRYLELCPTERTQAERLYAELVGRQGNGDLSEARRRLAARRDDDFRRGHTVVVHGWLLSRTEALACAIVALS